MTPSGGGAAFIDPSSEASTTLWLRAGDETYTDDGTTLVSSDGQAVQMIRNKLNTAERWRQTTAGSKPTHKTGILNSKPVWRFDGNDFLDHNNSDHFFGGSANTMIAVVSASSTTEYILSGSGGERGPAFITSFSSKEFEYFTHSSGERQTFAATASGFHILTVTRPEGVGSHKLYFDGALVATGTNVNNANGNWSGKFLSRIGRDAGAGSGGITADLAEVIQCTTVLSNARLNDMHTYLNGRYGIAITLL